MDLNEGITQAHINLDEGTTEESKCMIYRVHKHLRDINSNAYEPNVISIGPYHRGKNHLKRMEDHKLLLVEREGIDIMGLAAVVGGVASKARRCYADQDFELSESEFIKMLVLDGCFIIEFFLTCVGTEKKADPIFQMGWMLNSLLRDLMLFENQIPFFILRKLFNSIYPGASDFDIVHILSIFFSCLYPGSEPSPEEVKLRSLEVAQQGSEEIMHILDLIHRNWLPRESQKSEEEMSDAHAITIEKNGYVLQESEEKKSDTHTKGKKKFEFMYCATRLTEANVKFKVKEEAPCLFDIEFEDGTMKMPPLRIMDRTECLLRNLMAYEQYFENPKQNFVTQYMKLLDNLINSSKDVEILSRKGIIENWKGDDEVVATMVNKLGDSIVCDFDIYAKLYEDVNEHCGKRRNRWMAKLRRDYLCSPWAIISVVAAVVLLVLTVMQTVLSLLQVV